MRNLRLDIAYDGTDYFGWQCQPEKPTIQGCIESALERVLAERVRLIASSRTDAGVHATGQVANFPTAVPIPCPNLQKALNDTLPLSIRILGVREATPDFHARYHARVKIYRYRIVQAPVPSPFIARFAHHVPRPLDRVRMSKAARLVEGEHDFTSFAASDPASSGLRNIPESAVRCVFLSRLVWRPRTSILVYEIRGNGFLYRMVRNIVGTLLEIGLGRLVPDEMGRILDVRQRARAGPTAPARGLCLAKVEY
ncbi:MAG: tRNA pseudouridine(38-40) synthase TruA [Terriglobia bacterium]